MLSGIEQTKKHHDKNHSVYAWRGIVYEVRSELMNTVIG